MYFSKTPLRISFIGGGSDMQSFYSKKNGMVLSTSIDKYVYLTMHKLFQKDQNLLKYSKIENVTLISEIKHPIIREVFNSYSISNIDFNSSADIPGGTGLGSSSAFTAGLINLCLAFKNQKKSNYLVAEEACKIEINRLNEPIGKQDQYACAIGGFNQLTFCSNGEVLVDPVNISSTNYNNLNNSLFLYYTGIQRSASKILKVQKQETKKKEKFEVIDKMVRFVPVAKQLLEDGDLDGFGKLLHEGWKLKKQITSNISNNFIDNMYNMGIKNGAIGGKLLGAGGGGFLLFYTPSKNKVRFQNEMNKKYREVPFKFEKKGSLIKKL